MGTATITGPITSIVYDDTPPVDWTIVSLSDGQQGVDAPTVINPSGTPVTIVLATNTVFSGPGHAAGFTLASSFNVGDVVEIYFTTNGLGSLNVSDENGNPIFPFGGNSGISTQGLGLYCRKIATGSTFPTWGVVG